MRTWRNLGGGAKLASFFATKLAANLATLASLVTMLAILEPSDLRNSLVSEVGFYANNKSEMDEQLKALLEGINALKSSQEETKERMENMQRSQKETKERMENMQRSQKETKERMENMQRSQEEIKNELKERMEKGHQKMLKGQEELRNTLEKKIDSVEEK
ncbi:hypothetical protein TNCV_2682961 [Trichonephila clavipes]|nr:hypothetical protein TNCV_2682961 [Trichonephila clavipes]